MSYAEHVDLIDCTIGDRVYIYSKEILDRNGKVDENMIGVVESIYQHPYEDWLGFEYLEYTIAIRMKDGKRIKIKDEQIQPFLRKYEFITIKDLIKMHNINFI